MQDGAQERVSRALWACPVLERALARVSGAVAQEAAQLAWVVAALALAWSVVRACVVLASGCAVVVIRAYTRCCHVR